MAVVTTAWLRNVGTTPAVQVPLQVVELSKVRTTCFVGRSLPFQQNRICSTDTTSSPGRFRKVFSSALLSGIVLGQKDIFARIVQTETLCLHYQTGTRSSEFPNIWQIHRTLISRLVPVSEFSPHSRRC